MSLFSAARNTGNVKVPDLQNTNSRYCIVVGSFSSFEKAQNYGTLAQSKGYEVSYRDNGNGFYRVLLHYTTQGITKYRTGNHFQLVPIVIDTGNI
ncbi:MAG: SPOR domain-containing protein [Prolixibacteraceae bacterium]|jgi:hypothetical protein|nr:SPOR domain-containing protein [Prolixibacteraceae bacterium]